MWPFGRTKDEQPQPAEQPRRGSFFSSDLPAPGISRATIAENVLARNIQRDPPAPIAADGSAVAMDESMEEVKALNASFMDGIPDAQLSWYGSFGFIGYQTCAMLAQHWLIDKACTMPARDAVRVGYTITSNDGSDIAPDVLDALRDFDKTRKIDRHMVEFERLGRVFGIRVAMFVVESDDPEYYEKPFNPDGVRPGSYKGIAQVDPYWMSPELSLVAASRPESPEFYEPTWWRISGKRVHRSHLVIMRTCEMPDILKPTYLYGGIPVPQRIAERVYAAERTANEAPQLAMTKRTTVLGVDASQALQDQQEFERKLAQWGYYRDNYGVKVKDTAETIEQFDTTLADLDVVIMTQYQIVAAAAGVPATKLLGTTPKGFNATGEYEESSYHEELESIQVNDLSPLLERHHLLAIRSEIAPKFEIPPFATSVTWNTLDALTAKEQAEINQLKAQTGAVLVQSGAIDGEDERQRLIADPDSGYSGVPDEMPEDTEAAPDEEGGPVPPPAPEADPNA